MTEPIPGPDRGRTTAPERVKRALEWLRGTFAGLTWGRAGTACLLLFLFAMSRPPVMSVVLGGKGFAAAASASIGPLTVVFCRFVPLLLCVVAAANRGPREGWSRIAWFAGALVLGGAIGTTLAAIALPRVAPVGVLATLIDLNAPARVQAIHWIGLSLGDLALSAVPTAFWYYFKRNEEASTAVHQAQQDREESRRESAEARLLVMQAQIEPHFLFNTLASIRRLYETDAGSGRAMLRHLSNYLAASLPALRAERSTLGRELELATAYLSVQKIRMGTRLVVDVDVPSSLSQIEIPPMMLATLVENAIVHGVGPLPEGGRIRIAARLRQGRLTIEVADDGRGLEDAWGAGIGLANIGARLRSQFGGAASVTLANATERGAIATLDLPLPAPRTQAA